MQIIPLSAVPSQTLSVVLNGQNCRLNVYEKRGYAKRVTLVRPVTDTQPDQPLLDEFGHPILDEFGDPITDDEASQTVSLVTEEVTYTFPVIFVDVYVDDVLIIAGSQAQNGVTVIPNAYLAFNGYLAFIDLQGEANPSHSGLDDRWILIYFTDDELRL